MKKLFAPLFLFTLIFSSCYEFSNDPKAVEKIQDSIDNAKKTPDSVPHIITIGNGKTFAFKPDSCFNDLVLGDPKSFKNFRRESGSKSFMFSKDRYKMAWYNLPATEELEVMVTGTENGGFFPYEFILQKAKQKGSPEFDFKHEYVGKNNFISGHGIYIGMSPEYVKVVYQSQTMTEWKKGDTLYLNYKPQQKDSKYYSRYDYRNYSATYKFVDGLLRRIEYRVEPDSFEPVPMKD